MTLKKCCAFSRKLKIIFLFIRSKTGMSNVVGDVGHTKRVKFVLGHNVLLKTTTIVIDENTKLSLYGNFTP